jgi:hypothetical protein
MHMNRFVVFQLEDEWLVTYGGRKQASFTTREEAEHSAFHAADAMASRGHAVSVLIMPNGLEAHAPPQTVPAPGARAWAPTPRDAEVTCLSRLTRLSLESSHASRRRDCRRQSSDRAR